tara:strand:+ start:5104 stop:5577 length:474 start_codon:yes stop_codon:yes gene_type:complete
MPSFSKRSLGRLYTCHPDLVVVMLAAIKAQDCTVLEGVRSDERQQELYHQGKSKLDGVTKKSKHQVKSDGWSHAVDVAPWPTDWNTSDEQVRKVWLDFARLVLSIGDDLGIKLRWGGDWNSNWNYRGLGPGEELEDPTDDPAQRFNDWPHFELSNVS